MSCFLPLVKVNQQDDKMDRSLKMLNVAKWSSNSVVNGPGARYVIWLQGCPILCPGCINPDLQPFIPAYKFTAEELSENVINTDGIEGITISGGEPMSQAENVVPLLKIIKEHGLSILCYSGYRLDELRNSRKSSILELLNLIDILIDGPYIDEQADGLLWRGSRNQQVHFLSDRYADWVPKMDQSKSLVEIKAGNFSWSMTGIWQDEFAARLEKELKNKHN